MKAFLFDLESIPIFQHKRVISGLDPLAVIGLKEEYEKYQKGDLDSFISYPAFNSIVSVAWSILEMDDKTNRIIKVEKKGSACHDDEKALVKQLASFLNSAGDISLFVHFNGRNYDVPLFLYKCLVYGINVTNKKFKNLYKYSAEHHFDLKDQVSHYGVYPINFRTLCLSMGVGDPKEDCSGAEVLNLWKQKCYSRIENYNRTDVDKLQLCFEKLYPLLKK